MNKKYFFFDIDGTLTVSPSDPFIPQSTLDTIDALRAKGHFVAIATGRAFCMAKNAMNKTHMNNLVCNGGYGLCLDGKLIGIEPLDREKSLLLSNELISKGFAMGVVDGDELRIQCPDDKFLKIASFMNSEMKIEVVKDFDLRNIKEFHKIFVGIEEDQEKEIENINILPYMRYHPMAMVFEMDDKYRGIEKMVEYVGGKLEDVVVFGDGKNDMDMFRKAPFSIAMGNAIEPLKQIASYITDNSIDDGIYKACLHFGWID